jgi:phospholipid/cholesterol/gamma-HCH transport system substrate-binding protein
MGTDGIHAGEEIMSHSLTRIQAFLLGIVVLLGLGLAIFALFLIQGTDGAWAIAGYQLWGEKPFHVRAGFHDVQGVSAGVPVRIQGMDAGEVERVDAPKNPGEPVIMVLKLNAKQRQLIRSDARVQIVSEGMIGGKVVQIDPGTAQAAPAEENALLATVPSTSMTDLAKQLNDTVKGVRDGEGALGKEAVDTLRQIRSTMATFEQVGDAGKSLPIVRNYVKDPLAALVRPDCECNRYPYNESDLFEPGRAVLTADGRRRLDELAPRLNGLLQHDKAELVVVACADPSSTDDRALLKTVTRGQSEAVCQYLKDERSVQKAGWFTSRKVTALGLGLDPPPDEKWEATRPARIEIRVFVPQK